MSEQKEKSQGITLNAEQLQEMLRAVLAEARKPADLTPEQQSAKDQALKDRADVARQSLIIQQNKEWERKHCTHRRADNTNATVSVMGVDGAEYRICQICQGKIKQAQGPFDEPGQFIYDTNLYFQLMQSTSKPDFS